MPDVAFLSCIWVTRMSTVSSGCNRMEILNFFFFSFLKIFFHISTVDSDPFTDSGYVICLKTNQGIVKKLSIKVLKQKSE